MILIREEERSAAERTKKKMLTVYIAAACIYVAAALLLLFFSSDHYTIWMIADILLTIAFGFGSVYFFTVVYDLAVKRSKLLDKIASALEEREYGVFLREEEKMTVECVEMRVLLFQVRGVERELHVYEGECSFETNKKYLLVVRCGVITEIEKVDE